MGGSEKFCLRWNDFETNISSAFKDLRDDKDFFDVTLSCDDDEQIKAHKVILSACSPFFRNVLRRNPHPHPLLYLKSVKYTDIQAVLNFMYHGEVNVAQEELNSFLAVAEDLRVKGLTQSSNPTKPQESTSSANKTAMKQPGHRNDHVEKHKLDTRPTCSKVAPDDDIVEYVPVKSEPKDGLIQHHQPTPPVEICTSYSTAPPSYTAVSTQDMVFQEQESYDDYNQYSEGGYVGETGGNEWEGNKGDISEIIVQVDPYNKKSPWNCLLCGKEFQCKGNGRRHVETMHYETPSLTCTICGNILKNKNSYQNHMTIVHGHNKGVRKQNQ